MTAIDHAKILADSARRLDTAITDAHRLADDMDGWLDTLNSLTARARALTGR